MLVQLWLKSNNIEIKWQKRTRNQKPELANRDLLHSSSLMAVKSALLYFLKQTFVALLEFICAFPFHQYVLFCGHGGWSWDASVHLCFCHKISFALNLRMRARERCYQIELLSRQSCISQDVSRAYFMSGLGLVNVTLSRRPSSWSGSSSPVGHKMTWKQQATDNNLISICTLMKWLSWVCWGQQRRLCWLWQPTTAI